MRTCSTVQGFARHSSQLSVELARAERLAALGRMSAGLAHEIRNPIGAMRLQAENALAKNAVEAYQNACEGMLQNIDRLDDLLERLLAIVRLDRLTPKSTKIQPWIEESITPFQNAGNPALDRVHLGTARKSPNIQAEKQRADFAP